MYRPPTVIIIRSGVLQSRVEQRDQDGFEMWDALCFPFLPSFLKHACRSSFSLLPMRISFFTHDIPQPSLCLICLSDPLLFGLIAQRGDQGLNIDSRGESPCVLKQRCLSALLSSHPPAHRPNPPFLCSLSRSR